MHDTLRLTLPKTLIALMDRRISDGDFVDRSDLVRTALRHILRGA